MKLTIEAEVLREFDTASSREWLVTNGIGGYASGSLSGAHTRRYHGLLIAALTPPTGRMTLLSRLEEALTLEGVTYELAANQYPGAIYPQGYQYLERYETFPVPTFLYRPQPDLALEKQIWMAHGSNTTYVRYTLQEAPAAVRLRLTPLVCWKSYHAQMHPWPCFPQSTTVLPGEIRFQFTPDSPALRLLADATEWEPADYWHANIEQIRERERGFDAQEDLYCAGHLYATLQAGESLTVIATAETDVVPTEQAWTALLTRQQDLLCRARANDPVANALILAADTFLIDGVEGPGCAGYKSEATCLQPRVTHPSSPIRSTLIAGYHWFADWGRDTMIALPGLCLATGRMQVARDILTSFAGFVSEGMLPNRFPDLGETPEYNTADATLWYFHAIGEYIQQAEDGLELAQELWPVLQDIVSWHLRGTRYGIQVDPADGLLRAGEPGVQLTWMDAKVGDRVVTPRIGKPVEINALWIHALRIMETLTLRLGEDPGLYRKGAALATRSFRAAFVRPDGYGLYDVIGAEGPDASIRPNQIFAVSLPHSPLTLREQKSVVRIVEDELLTPFGLRSLSPKDPVYCAHYGGGPQERDAAYHQGTVWPWLLGAFVTAHLKVYRDPACAHAYLLPLEAHLREAGVGFVSEILDAEPPYRPNGCVAQAWSVAEILRAWIQTMP